MATSKNSKKAAGKKPAGKKAAAKPAPKAKASSKKAAPKASKSTKAAPKGKKSKGEGEIDFANLSRKAGSLEDVNTALDKSQYGRFMFISTKNPEKTIRILDDPADWMFYDRHWPDGLGMDAKHACLGDGCPTCAAGDQPLSDVIYFRVMVIGEDGKGKQIMLYEPPKGVVKDLLNHAKRRGGTLLDRDYTISRTGSTKNDTRYTVINEDKKKRETEIKKLEKSDPVDIAEEFKRMWEAYLRELSKADTEEEDDEPATTSDGAAEDLNDDDDDENDVEDDDADDGDDDDDEDESDDDDEDDDDEDEEEEDDEDESDDDDDADDDSDDDDEDEEEEDDDDDDDEDGDDATELKGTFEVLDFDLDEATLHVVDTDTGEDHPAVYFDEDEVDIKFKKGMLVKFEAQMDDENDWLIETIEAVKGKAKPKAAAKGKGKKK